MQISVVGVAFDAENKVPYPLTGERQQREIDERPVQQSQARLTGLRRERQQTSGFSPNRDYHSQPVQRVVAVQDRITNGLSMDYQRETY